MRTSARMDLVTPSVIPMVAELIRRTPGTISLGQGVAHYPPPHEAEHRLRNFWDNADNHRYHGVRGIDPLLDEIHRKLSSENQITLETSGRIVVTPGSNMAFHYAIAAIADPGDEIILLSPYFFNHEMTVNLSDCVPRIVPTRADFLPDIDAIENAISDRTRAVVTVSPNNPTGVVYSKSALTEINRLCGRYGIYHISDEAYEYFVYEGSEHFSPGSLSESEGHTITLYTLSKAYGFASWRVGYMVVPSHLSAAIDKIQDTLLICPPVASQYAGLGALEAGREYCSKQIETIDLVRKLFVERLGEIDSFCCIGPAEGAFYLFLKMHERIDSLGLVRRLIDEFRVAVIPGGAFGLQHEDCLRISYGAVSPNVAEEGIGRVILGLKQILGGRMV